MNYEDSRGLNNHLLADFFSLKDEFLKLQEKYDIINSLNSCYEKIFDEIDCENLEDIEKDLLDNKIKYRKSIRFKDIVFMYQSYNLDKIIALKNRASQKDCKRCDNGKIESFSSGDKFSYCPFCGRKLR